MSSCLRRTSVASLLILGSCCSLLADNGGLLARAERAVKYGSGDQRTAVAEELSRAGYRDPSLQPALRGAMTDRERVLQTLENLRQLEELDRPTIPAGVAERARRILRDPIFSPPPNGQTVGEWLAERIGDFLSWLARLTSGFAPSAEALDNVLTWVGFIAAGAAVAVAVIVVLLRRRASVSASAMSRREIGDHEYTRASSREWLRLADESASLGNLKVALRYLLLAALARLDEAGVIHHEPGLTNGEYVRRVRSRDAARFAHLPQLVLAYDGAWYGAHQVTAELVRKAREYFGHVDAACEEIAR